MTYEDISIDNLIYLIVFKNGKYKYLYKASIILLKKKIRNVFFTVNYTAKSRKAKMSTEMFFSMITPK